MKRRVRRGSSRRHVRRPGMKGDWVLLAVDHCGDPLNTEDACDAPAAVHVNSVLLIDANDLGAKQDSLTIMRIVGQIETRVQLTFSVAGLTAAGSGLVGFTICEGIYLTSIDDTGAIVQLDPAASIDMESDHWMWRRVNNISFAINSPAGPASGTAAQNVGDDRESRSIDIRVKRKLVQGDVIVYSAHCVRADSTLSTGGFGDFALSRKADQFFDLRGYVKF